MRSVDSSVHTLLVSFPFLSWSLRARIALVNLRGPVSPHGKTSASNSWASPEARYTAIIYHFTKWPEKGLTLVTSGNSHVWGCQSSAGGKTFSSSLSVKLLCQVSWPPGSKSSHISKYHVPSDIKRHPYLYMLPKSDQKLMAKYTCRVQEKAHLLPWRKDHDEPF